MHHTTTSLHHINADWPLGKNRQVAYLALNRLNNALPYWRIDPSLEIRDFHCEMLQEYRERLEVKSSPSRKLSDLFWMSLPWPTLQSALGAINILDTGCGSGSYGQRLMEWSGGRIASYTGIDVVEKENWVKLSSRYAHFKFYRYDNKDALPQIPPGTNFFMSQSAIEHFDEDLVYFQHIRDYIRSSSQKVMQVHLFPSSACLRLYLLHGIRQYTPRTVSKITRLFHGLGTATLYRLGGEHCNQVHRRYITGEFFRRNVDMRNTKTQEYDKDSLEAILQDMRFPQKNPSFYALVMRSNGR